MKHILCVVMCIPLILCQDCFNEVTDTSGTLTDGSATGAEYDTSTICVWNIHPPLPDGEQLKITFTRIDFDSGDYVDLDTYGDGTRVERLEGAITGEELATKMFMGNGFRLTFTIVNGGANGHRGFQLEYDVISATCSELQTFTGRSGLVEDGSGLLNYEDNLHCEFLIEPSLSNGEYLRFEVIYFITRSEGDVVELYHGTSSDDVLVHRMWTDNINYAPNQETYFISTSGAWFLRFTTDGSGTARGWQIKYDVIDNPCHQPDPAGDLVFGWIWTTEDSGVVTDMSPPNTQYTNQKCWFVIQPDLRDNELINVVMTKNDIHSFDWLKIYDDKTDIDVVNTNIGILEREQVRIVTQEIYSDDDPEYAEFTSTFLVILWESWQSKAADHGYTGWTFEYDTIEVGCDDIREYTNNPSIFEDGSGTANYAENLDCYYLVNIPIVPNGRLRLRFWWIDLSDRTEEDKISIIHGDDPGDPVVREVIDYQDEYWFHSPDDAFIAFQSTTKPFLIRFQTDNLGSADGFKIIADVVTRGDGPQCQMGATYFTDRSETVSDGSGPNEPYFKTDALRGLSNFCVYVIAPDLPAGEAVQIKFTRFNVRPSDKVRIYPNLDVIQNNFNDDTYGIYGQTEEASFSGDIFDFSDMVFIGSPMVVHFYVADIYDENGSGGYFGWEFDYDIVKVGGGCSGTEISQTVSGERCVFPFTDPATRTTYHECTPRGDGTGSTWCATSVNDQGEYMLYETCHDEMMCIDHATQSLTLTVLEFVVVIGTLVQLC